MPLDDFMKKFHFRWFRDKSKAHLGSSGDRPGESGFEKDLPPLPAESRPLSTHYGFKTGEKSSSRPNSSVGAALTMPIPVAMSPPEAFPPEIKEAWNAMQKDSPKVGRAERALDSIGAY